MPTRLTLALLLAGLTLGPAATVHVAIPDWAKFALLHLRGERGEASLLEPATFRVLHTPAAGSEYAGGWIVVDRPWAGAVRTAFESDPQTGIVGARLLYGDGMTIQDAGQPKPITIVYDKI